MKVPDEKNGSMADLKPLQDLNKDAKNMIAKNKKQTYFCICSKFRPQKKDPYRVRFTVGKNLIDHQVENYTPTTGIITAKFLLNSLISANSACLICIDLSNFYLITPFNNKSYYENVWIPEWVMPENITEEYNLKIIVQNGRVLDECRTCI